MSKPSTLLSMLCLLVSGFAHLPIAAVAAPDAIAPAAESCRLADAPPGHFAVQIPFELIDGRIYVQARVNKLGPFRFAVDTGASGIGRADTTLAGALGLTPHGKTSTSDGVQAAAVDTLRLESIALDGLEKTGVDVITRDYGSRMRAEARFYGILARDFFADGLLVLDYPRKVLSFSRVLSLPLVGKGILGYERAFRIPVSIGDVKTEANLDTGANIGFVMPQTLYTQVSRAPLAEAGSGTLTNTRIETWRGVVPGPVTLGATRLRDVEVRVSDTYPELLVGAHALQRFVVLIDQRVKRIALCER